MAKDPPFFRFLRWLGQFLNDLADPFGIREVLIKLTKKEWRPAAVFNFSADLIFFTGTIVYLIVVKPTWESTWQALSPLLTVFGFFLLSLLYVGVDSRRRSP